LYSGENELVVSSNMPVELVTEDGRLDNAGYSIQPDYAVENLGIQAVARNAENPVVASAYRLSGSYRLGSTSDQPAGHYSGSVTVTILPDIDWMMRCAAQDNNRDDPGP
jgi:hypothetical protein